MNAERIISFAVVALACGAFAENRVVDLGNGERAAIFDEAGEFKFTVPGNITGTAQILVVGGGGAGGGIQGGGGGGGQVVVASGIELTPGADIALTVGAGGNGGQSAGGNGGSSSFLGYSAVGGGGGSGGWSPGAGKSGANGGGGARSKDGGASNVVGGYAGGSGSANAGGGGGGAGGAGQNGGTRGGNYGGNGGAAVTNDITGELVGYGAGGGGSALYNLPGTCGLGGCLDGYGDSYRSSSVPATAGRDGTGGGGGAGYGNGASTGGKGGTGTVIVRYAVNVAQVTVDFLAQDTVGLAPLAVQFTAQVDKPNGANAVLTWDFGDGSASLETSETTVSHTYSAVGLYSVSVSVSAAGQIAQKTIANCVEVASRYIYVDNSSENEVAPYATPQTAAKTIDAALAAISTAGQTIRVMPGNYVQPYPAVLDKAVTVMGMGESPTNVVVEQTAPIVYNDDQNKVTRNIFTLNHADAIVCNLTMKKGWHRMVSANPSAGGVVVQSNGGTVSNCVITGCVSARNNHGAAGADLVAGLITHTLIEDCEVDNPNLPYTPRHGGASAIRLAGNGRAENCLVRNCNRGAASDQFHAVLLNGAGARAVNLTIVSCGSKSYSYQDSVGATTPSCGLYVEYGQAVNCVVADVYEAGEPAVNRAWGGASGSFVNCATDTAEAINDTCATISTADFRNFAASDFRPRSGGPLVNAGSATCGFTARNTDFAGDVRVFGRAVDIGCYECQSAGLAIFVR